MADKKTDELKNEAVKTANDAKDSVSKADFKTEAKKTSNFVFELFRDPISSIEGVVTDKKNTKFITAIIIFAVWLLFIFINSFQGIGALGWGYFWTQVFETFKSITGEDDDKKAIRNFMVIQGIYFIVYFVLSLNFIGIYLPIL